MDQKGITRTTYRKEVLTHKYRADPMQEEEALKHNVEQHPR